VVGEYNSLVIGGATETGLYEGNRTASDSCFGLSVRCVRRNPAPKAQAPNALTIAQTTIIFIGLFTTAASKGKIVPSNKIPTPIHVH
jgi:hypothetical protein